MQDLRVHLTKTSMKALGEAASALSMTPERTFEYLVRNTLPSYPNLAEGGYHRYFHDGVRTTDFSIKDQDESVIGKIASKLHSPGKPAKAPRSDEFVATISTAIQEEVKSTAKHFEMNATDLYNRLVQVGSDLATHLKTGTVYAFNKKNQNLGTIEFKQ